MFSAAFRFVFLCMLASVSWAASSAAASAQEVPANMAGGPGTPVPLPPATVARDAAGRVTVRAVRTRIPIVLDGRLDDEAYVGIQPIDGFIQQEPREGEPAENKTEVWLLYDDRQIYVGARCSMTAPDRIVANEMRRDGHSIFQNDNFGVFFDTFHDRRNGVFFYTNPLAAIGDQLISDERDTNRDWNTVWDVRTGRFEHGWTVEMAIPFRSLRYASPGPQVWGVQFRRIVRAANEFSYLTRMPAAFTERAIVRVSQEATLVGLEAPPAALNLEVKPYAVAKVETDLVSAKPFRNDPSAAGGVDMKYTLPNGLVADLTVNTDFAQVEDDEQQVNLTRFSLFFPERREFFLEGAGVFAFGGASLSPRGGGQQGGGPSNTPILFYSRQIGLHETEENDSFSVPIVAGGRLVGRSGAYTIGVLDVQQREKAELGAPATNFAVLRVKRDIFAQSSIGAIFTNRSRSAEGPGSSQAVGVDAAFTFFRDLTINAYYARTHAANRSRDAASYRAQVQYAGDRYGLQVEHLSVEPNFDPEVGFLRRRDFRRNYAQLRFSPRPARSGAIRKYFFEASLDHFTNSAGRLESRQVQAQAGMDLSNGDQWRIEATGNYEFLDDEFDLRDDEIIVPAGGYRFAEFEARYQLGPQRKVNGSVSAGAGHFYGGTRRQAGYRGRIEISPRLGIEPGLSFNWIDVPQGSFATALVTGRVNYSLSPRTGFSALLQYNSADAAIGANLRFRWEFRPGSDFYVVYNDGRDTSLGVRRATTASRMLAVKITRLVRF
ncbi:MAG: DUF5916 domain-containing protein [Vicinamibacterales bacterium]